MTRIDAGVMPEVRKGPGASEFCIEAADENARLRAALQQLVTMVVRAFNWRVGGDVALAIEAAKRELEPHDPVA